MVVISTRRNTNDDIISSPAVSRATIPRREHGWQLENQRRQPHITMTHVDPQSLVSTGNFRHTTGEAKPLTLSTPGPTPLRTPARSSLTPLVTETAFEFTTSPSLLPATGTTLIVSPPPMSSTILATKSAAIGFSSVIEIPKIYDSPTSSPSILTNPTKIHPRLPIPAIAAIATGGFFMLVGSLLLVLCLRTSPSPRRLPVPSLPKLEDDDMDKQGLSTQESPLFGPKERFSQRQGLHPQWTWATYLHNQPAPEQSGKSQSGYSSAALNQGSSIEPRMLETAVTSHRKSSSIYPASGHFQTLSAPVGSPLLSAVHPSLQQVQAALTRTANRMSAMSFACPSDHPNAEDLEIACSGDGQGNMKRRSRTLRKSRSNSVYEACRRVSRTPTGLAYDGADVTSPIPTMEFMPIESPGLVGGFNLSKVERRTRIQTPYYIPGSYPRISSAMPTAYGVTTRVKLGDGTSVQGVSSPMSKLGSQRAKETQAPAHTLGLMSPTTEDSVPSPQPTLGPDDSLSVVESKRLLKQRSKRGSTYLGDNDQFNQASDGRRQHLFATPTRTVVAVASGSLLSTEDIKGLASGNNAPGAGVAMSLDGPTLANSKSLGIKPTLASSKTEGRTDDKPPRVPSPPPLPSLAQMALGNYNPDAYASYRSPTYSIYNLYDDNRRSAVYGSKR